MQEEGVRAVEIRTGHLEEHRDNAQVCWVGEPKEKAEEEVELVRDLKCRLLEVHRRKEGQVGRNSQEGG